MLSVEATNAAKYLLKDPCSLFAQSKMDPQRLQSDGWGIGFYTDGVANLVKSEKPVYAEPEKFASAVQGIDSKIILAHIRRASNPKGLPKERLRAVENSQPFAYERYVFAHNGVINIPDEVAESLGGWKQRIRGVNDSEVFFWHLAKAIANGASFPKAIKNFQKTLSELWQNNRERHLDKSRPYMGLNVVFSDGENLCAYCKYGKEDESARSLCLKDQPVFQMAYIANPTSLIIASEKTNRSDGWQLLKNGQALTGRIADGKIEIALKMV
jgi:predicted glutamine amidotransferase